MKASRYCLAIIGFMAIACVACLPGCGQNSAQPSGTGTPEATPPQAVTSVPPAPVPLPPSMREAPVAASSSGSMSSPGAPEQQSPQEVEESSATVNESKEGSPATETPDVARDLIQLYEKVAELKDSKSPNPDDVAELDKKCTELLGKAKVVHYTDKLDLLAFDIRMITPKKAKVSLLVRANEQLTSDYKVVIGAEVKKDFKEFLSPNAEVDKLRENIAFWPNVRSTNWAPGRPILLSTEAELKAIPYQISVGFGANKPPHMLGDGAQVIGWFADVEE